MYICIQKFFILWSETRRTLVDTGVRVTAGMDLRHLLQKFVTPRDPGARVVGMPSQFQELYERHVEVLTPVEDVLQGLGTQTQGSTSLLSSLFIDPRYP